MKLASTIARYLLGVIFLLAGAAGLFNFAPPPQDLPQDMMTFMSGMMAAKYFFPLLKITEMVSGLFLILQIAPALILMILAPIIVNIFFVHAFLTPGLENLVVPVLIVLLYSLSVVNYWHLYRPLFRRNK